MLGTNKHLPGAGTAIGKGGFTCTSPKVSPKCEVIPQEVEDESPVACNGVDGGGVGSLTGFA